MMRFFVSFFCLLTLECMSSVAQTQSENTPSISSLDVDVSESVRTGHRVEISFRSRGCFHSDQSKIVLDKHIATVEGLGNVHISPTELEHLDSYFTYAREKGSGGGCTTVNSFELSVWQNENIVKSEIFEDSTCIASLPPRYSKREEPWMTPSRIVRLLELKYDYEND